MENLLKHKSAIAILIVLIMIGAVVYFYFFKPEIESESALMYPEENQNTVDAELFALINKFKQMRFDTSVLMEDKFLSLKDLSQEIPFMEAGRIDPFGSIGTAKPKKVK